ncbi:MAG TPA: serine hydrolase domain-containing protein [Mycobacteriales bacterium]|nr:serine hydrolase domain-containing protein [Mycobacteriales bacterium]
MTETLPAEVHARLGALPGLPAADEPGLALGVYVDGRLVHGTGHGLASLEHGVPISPYSLFDIASVSKQFTAACVLQLALANRVDLDADLRTTHFPELSLEVPITARQCIHHTAGVRDFFSLLDLAGRGEHDVPDNEAVIAFLARQRRTSFPPGERHLYSNSGYILLAEIVHRVTGSTLREYAHEAIFTPLGMTSTHFRDDAAEVVRGRANGHAKRETGGWLLSDAPFGVVGDGGLLTNLVDLARWVDFLQTGCVLGQPLRDAMHVRAVLADGTEHEYAGGLDHQVHRGVDTVGHGGAFVGFRAHLLRAPAHGVAVAVLGNRADLSAQPIALDALWVVLNHLGVELEPVDAASPDAEGTPVEPLRLGLWRDPETMQYARTVDVEGQPHLEALGFSLVARPAAGCHVLEGLPLPLAAKVDDERLVLLLAGRAGVLPAYDAVTPTPIPSGLPGTYRSDELEVDAVVLEADGAVEVRVGRKPDPVELLPGIDGEVWHKEATLRVVRAGDGIAALEVSNGRAVGVRFDRVDA